jgi:hypothetical protein
MARIITADISGSFAAPEDFISTGEGVYEYTFGGDATYLDDQGVTFVWNGRRSITLVRSVRVDATIYSVQGSVAGVASTESSFYYDSGTTTLYVHHANDTPDRFIPRSSFFIGVISVAFSSGVLPGRNSYYNGIYYDPRLVSNISLDKTADSLQLGLLTFAISEIRIVNADGAFDDPADSLIFNSLATVTLLDETVDTVEDGIPLFAGRTAGAQINDDEFSLALSDPREQLNQTICPNVFDSTTYTSLDPKFEGTRIPVAYGDIRRAFAVPIDSDGVTSGTITLKLADESLGAIRSVTAVFDSNGNSVSFSGTNLTACTTQVTFSATSDVSGYSWSGQGYDLADGTYNNGLDIMRDVFEQQGNYDYNVGNFNTTEWEAATAALSREVGISVKSDKGLIEELIEPMTITLQGVVDVDGVGRISFKRRDPSAPITQYLEQYQILGRPQITRVTDNVVSTIVVEYQTAYVDDTDVIRTIRDDDQAEVIATFGVDRSTPISPVRTLLRDQADALLVASEIASTTTEPELILDIETPLVDDTYELFEIVQVDYGRPGEQRLGVFEVLGRSYDFRSNELTVRLRLRLLPDRAPFVDIPLENITTEGAEDITTENDAVLTTEG